MTFFRYLVRIFEPGGEIQITPNEMVEVFEFLVRRIYKLVLSQILQAGYMSDVEGHGGHEKGEEGCCIERAM
jgi:hypothetical protein